MTTELFYLALTALWLSALWVPFIVGSVKYDSANVAENFVIPPSPARLPPWVQRANRAHMNLVEQFAPYAVLIVILHLAGISNGWTVGAAAAFFWLRLVHAAVMWAGIRMPLRPVIFTGTWICIIILGWQALLA
ncbi:MAG: MAPEG family protein [Pseudomonadota bacterium]